MLLLVNLPDVVLKDLQSFLSRDDVFYFLNSNKCYFSSLKKETIYFSLNQEKSREYVEDERFRAKILSKVKDGKKQIALTFDKKFELPDIRGIIAHKIIFGRSYPLFPDQVSSMVYPLPNEVKVIPFLPMLQDLKLYNCSNLRDFSSLSHLKKLELSDAPQLRNLTPLQNIPHLSFVDCPNIRDFSMINSERQQFVSIDQSDISDISFLRNVQTVQLGFCNELVDVSPLHGIKNLSLFNCFNIRDISCLGNHHRLTLFNCTSVERGFDCFRTVSHADVRGSEVPDLRVFQEAKSLQINLYRSMESQLFFLKDIPDLTFRLVSKMEPKEYDVSHLRSIRLTVDDDMVKISGNSFSSQLRYLKLENCNQIVKIINEGKTSIFHHLQSLHITSCSILHVNGLGDIPTIILEKCLKLNDISGLGRNRSVELKYCPKISDVSSLAAVPIVTVINCNGIVDFSCLSSVPRLKIVKRR